MDAYRLFFLVLVCFTCVILQAKSEENTDARAESDMDFESLKIREKRRSSYFSSRYRAFTYRRCKYYKWTRIGRLTCLKLKKVDCLNNRLCQRYQVCCFGKVFKPPTSTVVAMMSTSTPVVSVAPSTPVMSVSPTNIVSQSVAPSSSVAPSPASSMVMVATV
ncbi:uncharacterized protein LOC110041745 [Orbicella faveolata]|uniref:uncharacterized protein LOC110041745 n=1 Tax=Orbicella faveolata TaxID=48498 RepID=UPI0009E1E683|nr:uncharacterized protein LOC110041745 [Orbicella faveolata]